MHVLHYALYQMRPSHVASRPVLCSVLASSKAAVRRQGPSHRSFESGLIAGNDAPR